MAQAGILAVSGEHTSGFPGGRGSWAFAKAERAKRAPGNSNFMVKSDDLVKGLCQFKTRKRQNGEMCGCEHV